MTFLKGQNPQGGPARRDVIAGIAAAGVVLAAGFYRFTDLIVKHYPPTPYDDLLDKLADREQAAKFGKTVPQHLHGDIVESNDDFAREARRRLAGRDLRFVTEQDAANGDVVEIEGWVVPATIALLATLAARV